uniref:Uncharacterized protein n=1 Tax=Salmonella enteritidis TaxID=149539 RepID=T1PWT8_SALEN|nr:hypothetical protein pS1400_89_0018 [Salmonella enterica subsp. enterica serovar Enteritidis]
MFCFLQINMTGWKSCEGYEALFTDHQHLLTSSLLTF